MKAMILAAGLGTRLRPLTDTRPKALVELAGRTLLEITLMRLRSFGIDEAIINVHHFADMVVDYLKSKNNFGMRIEISREDNLLLDTGGGLKKAAWFFLEHSQRAAKRKPSTVIASLPARRDGPAQAGAGSNPGKVSTQSNSDRKPDAPGSADEPFILHNVDVISTIDFRRMLQFHTENRALATLAVQSRESSRLLLFNDHLQLCARAATAEKAGSAVTPSFAPQVTRRRGLQPPRNASKARRASASEAPSKQGHGPFLPLAFSGIHVISPRLLPLLTEEGVFSIIDAYLRLAGQGDKILAFRADEYYWRDLGRPSDLSQAALDLQQKPYLNVE
jgi:NDP-sugar pyrophosphorylase family protein